MWSQRSSPAEQRTQIQQLADAILSDQSVGELAQLVEQDGLTDTQNRGKVDAVEHLTTDIYLNALPDGHFSIEAAKSYAKQLETADINSLNQYLTELGYATNITNSNREFSNAAVIRITGGSDTMNISQIQFSPGGGRHGINPYLKISTTDQGIIKIVFGSPETYRTSGNERATIIFAEEIG